MSKETHRKWPVKQLYDWLRIEPDTTVKIYHGYGDEEGLLVYGHVFRRSPKAKKSYKKNVWSNTISLIRLFLVDPCCNVKVRLNWGGRQIVEAVTDEDGFFKLEWKSEIPLKRGWHSIEVTAKDRKGRTITGESTILVPYTTQYAYVSDIDDTFLISHSSKLWKRLRVLFTKNARTRQPFDGVVKHYQLLAQSHAEVGSQNPFFYVSSSEWNLYEYIKEFCRNYELPEGVFLLSKLKQWYELLATGQGRHDGKFFRIARLLKEYPQRKFILLGDDTQQDPVIYTKLVEAFPQQIICVYWRHVRKDRKEEVTKMAEKIQALGVEICYFSHSNDAIEHSQKIGLINPTENDRSRKEIHGHGSSAQ